MHRIRRYIALGLALAGLALAVAGCSASVSMGDGSSPAGNDGGTTTSTKTYTNDQYGFTITYSDTLTQGEPVAGTGAGGSSVLDVVFADKSGPVVSDRYVNAVQTSVYELARELKPSEVKQIKTELQGIVDQLMARCPGATVVEKLSPVKVNGVPGFAFKYTYTEAARTSRPSPSSCSRASTSTRSRRRLPRDQWDAIKGDLEAAVQSFTVK